MSRLLVPTRLDALAVTSTDAADSAQLAWVDRTPAWGSLADEAHPATRGDDIEPAPCALGLLPGQASIAGEVGVHLHWALPDGLTVGETTDDGRVIYPAAPNRWLVVRRFLRRLSPGPDGAREPLSRAWIVESDCFLEGGPAQPAPVGQHNSPFWAFIDPDAADLAGEPAIRVGRIGRVHDAEAFREPDVPGDPPRRDRLPHLCAVGPADPLFAASYLACRNVFGLHDDLGDIGDDIRGPGEISYLLMGWYSPGSAGPLAGADSAQLDARLARLGWTLDGVDAPPREVVVHGCLTGVPWDPTDRDAPLAGLPVGAHEAPRIALGATASEALAALVADGDVGVERLWEAIEYELLGTLSAHDALAVMEEDVHARGFEAIASGVRWTARGRGSGLDHRQAPPPSLAAALTQINRRQADAERLSRLIEGLRGDAYTAWYHGAARHPGGGPDIGYRPTDALRVHLRDRIEPAIRRAEAARAARLAEVEARLERARGALAAVDRMHATIARMARTTPGARYEAPPTWAIEATSGSRFFAPRDPAVAIRLSGARSRKHGEDARLDERGGASGVPCRLPEDILASIATDDGPPLVPPEWALPALSYAVPTEARALWRESLLLDPAACDRKVALSAGLRALTSPLPGALPTARPPSKMLLPAGAGHGGWMPSWTPLMLEWSARWRPAFSGGEKSLDGVFEPWSFGEVDYVWAPPQGLHLPTAEETISGRTLLDPFSAERMAARLEAFVDGHARGRPSDGDDAVVKELRGLAAKLRDVHVVTQMLGGFHDRLRMIRPILRLPLLDPDRLTAGANRDENRALTALARALVGDRHSHAPSGEGSYQPVRSGSFALDSLWLIDAFGRALRVEDRLQESVRYSEHLRSPHPLEAGRAFLPPRIVQGARIVFDWLDAGPDDPSTDAPPPPTGPICGWILPDRVDDALEIFDAGGRPLGQVRIGLVGAVDGSDEPDAQERIVTTWEPAPGTGEPGQPRAPLPDAHLEAVVGSLLSGPLSGAEARAFSEVIDSTLWGVDPARPTGRRTEGVLVGRPLALVRAAVSLELFGPPEPDRHPGHLLHDTPTSLQRLEVPVRLGDLRMVEDGLIGFFRDGGDGAFWSVRPPPAASAALVFHGIDAWEGGGPRPRPVVLSPDPDAAPVRLTLLLDPRAGVHIRSGLLPAKYVSLPPAFGVDAIARMEPTFRVGPVLARRGRPLVPLPGEVDGHWTWTRRPPGTRVWAEERVEATGEAAHADEDGVELQDGWLRWHRHPPGEAHAPAPALTAAAPWPRPRPPHDPAPDRAPATTPSPSPVHTVAASPGPTDPPTGDEDLARRPSPFPFTLSVSPGRIPVVDRARPQVRPRERATITIGFPPRYQHATAGHRSDTIYFWFLWEATGGQVIAQPESGTLRTLAPISFAEGISWRVVGEGRGRWVVESLRGFEAAGTGWCWKLRRLDGRPLLGPDGPAGVSLEAEGLVATHPGQALFVAQAYVGGAHTDFAYLRLDKRPPVTIDHFELDPVAHTRFALRWRVRNAETVSIETTPHAVLLADGRPVDRARLPAESGGRHSLHIQHATTAVALVARGDGTTGYAEARRVRLVEREDGRRRAPYGTILSWSGAPSQIPPGWRLCDGEGDTPDLRDRFVIGRKPGGGALTGGARSVRLGSEHLPEHTHAVRDPGHSHAFEHTEVIGGDIDQSTERRGASHYVRHSSQTGEATTGIAVAPAGEKRPAAVPTIPPYYALCFIMATRGPGRRHPLTLASGRDPYGHGYAPPTFVRQDDLVFLDGMIAGRKGSGSPIGALPSGFRPARRHVFRANQHRWACHLEASADGVLAMRAPTGPDRWFSLSGMVISAARGVPVELTRGVRGFDPEDEAQIEAARSGHFIALSGRLRSMTGAWRTLGRLEEGARPPVDALFRVATDRGEGIRVVVEAGGYIEVRPDPGGQSPGWISLTGVAFSTRQGELITATDGIERVDDGFGAPQASRHGSVVALAGRAHAVGGASITLGTLPPDMRPVEQTVFTVESANGAVRLDVMPDGRLTVHPDTPPGDWVGLTGVHFPSTMPWSSGPGGGL